MLPNCNCGKKTKWYNENSLTVICSAEHRKRVKRVGDIFILRGKPGPKKKKRKEAHLSATYHREVIDHLREHGLGGQSIFEFGIAVALEKYPL